VITAGAGKIAKFRGFGAVAYKKGKRPTFRKFFKNTGGAESNLAEIGKETSFMNKP
jgi:hypothetical protein